jgi:hypothetical protein
MVSHSMPAAMMAVFVYGGSPVDRRLTLKAGLVETLQDYKTW